MPTHRTLALTCPSCGTRPVETAQRYSIIRGYLFFARLGSITTIGCQECVRRAGRQTLAANFALGWWAFPWCMLVPFYLVQNLVRLAARPPGCLQDALRESGLDAERYRIDQQGLTAIEWDLLRVAGAARRRFADASGIPLTEASGTAFLIALSDHRITASQAAYLLEPQQSLIPATIVPVEFRDQMLWTLGDLVPFDRAADFLAPLRAVAQWLQCTPETFAALLGALGEQVGAVAVDRGEIEVASATLGVRIDADRDEVHRAYKQLLLEWHPDRIAATGRTVEDATARTQTITSAYRTLMQARGWARAGAR